MDSSAGRAWVGTPAMTGWSEIDVIAEGTVVPKAYLVVEHIVTDSAKFGDYLRKVGPMIAKHGGRALAKGNAHQFPEGGHWKPELVAITEFPDMESLKAWYNSEEYQPLIALRKQCTSDLGMLIMVEGA